MNGLQLQSKFVSFVREFNEERPHEALAMKARVKSTDTYQGHIST
ncbi:hypothetical protein [uncultured Roseibium sp.]|nr:hypothetical protein [uncultured Roseibium sp.]